MRLAAALLACSTLVSAQPIDSLESQRQFDFWLGEWDVTNRFWAAAQGEAIVPGAKLLVYPALNRTALVEHYRGANWQGADILGFSIRAYDPHKEAWVILLNWPSTDAPFWTMEGNFDFNRGLFFGERQGPDGQTITTRYTFSDLIPGFYRWEVNTSTDAGATWTHPGFAMQGARRADSAAPIDTAWLHGADIDQRCTGDERNQLDFMTGKWTAETRTLTADGEWKTATTRLTSRPILAGCAILNTEENAEHNSLTTLAYDTKAGAWVAYQISDQAPNAGVFNRYEGAMQNDEFILTRANEDGATERLRWHAITENSFEWEHATSKDASETWVLDVTAKFTRWE